MPLRPWRWRRAETSWTFRSGSKDLIQGATYHYRLVASNLFGIRFGENRSFVMPNFLFSDTLPNAWRITDNSQVSGSIVNYGVTLTPSQRAEATSKGWRLATTTAITDNFGDTKTMIFVYGEGNRRFNFWLYHDTDGDLTVELDGETPQKLTSGGVGAADYHTHEIEFANGTATYRFNGNLIASGWDGLPIADWMGRVEWGAGSSPGRGEMKVHRVEFVIGGTNIIASYIAGTAGNPSTAPAPTTQGWTISPTTGTTRGAVSPDPVGFRPVPIVETAPAKFVGAHERYAGGPRKHGGTTHRDLVRMGPLLRIWHPNPAPKCQIPIQSDIPLRTCFPD